MIAIHIAKRTRIVRFDSDGYPVVRLDNREWTVRTVLSDGDSNTKTRKNRKRGYLTFGCSLAPYRQSGVGNLCPFASPGCVEACLDHQGMGAVFRDIHLARVAKSIVFQLERQWFLDQAHHELLAAERKSDREGSDLAGRLNIFSDYPWETTGLIQDHPRIEFYDYTKNPKRAGLLLPNYWVTFSRSEINHNECLRVLSAGHNVAIPFDTGRVGNQVSAQACADDLPRTWLGYPVIDGDVTDLRFLDPRGRTRGRVVGLRLKAYSHQERNQALSSGFAV